jgi:putative FmdB family regulatory protein
MPIYEYACQACGHELEVMQKIADAVLADCPACGKPSLKKMISAAGFQLKGNGWYATDFKGKAKAAAAKETESSSSTDTKKPGGCGSGSCGCH